MNKIHKNSKKIKILLVMFAPYETVQMQIAALSAILKKYGAEVRYLEIPIFSGDTFIKYAKSVSRNIADYNPDMVGFSSYDMNFDFINECADFIKRISPEIKIIVGGHSCSLAPHDFMSNKAIDYVFIGEAEETLKDFLYSFENKKDFSRIEGLCSRDKYGIPVINPAKGCVEDLDSLPFLDRTIVEEQQKHIDYLPMFAGKGCPFTCTYCSNESMRKLYPNQTHYVRFRSPENIVEEIRQNRKVFKFRYVFFYDDIFILNYDWLKKFSKVYKEAFSDLPFYCLLHPSMATSEERIRLLAESGCERILMGVESGSEEYRKRMLNRTMTNDTLLKARALIKKHGIEISIFLMTGMPDESILDLCKSLSLNLRMKPDGVQTAIYFPLKNTPLYDYCLKHKLINEKRRKKIFVYTYNSCLNYNVIKRVFIILFKWINSASPIFCHFDMSLVRQFFRIQFKKWFKGKVDYK